MDPTARYFRSIETLKHGAIDMTSPYIHYTKKGYDKHRVEGGYNNLAITDSLISNTYRQQAENLDNEMMKSLKEEFRDKKTMSQVVKLYEEIGVRQVQESAFKEVNNILSNTLLSFSANDIKLTQLAIGEKNYSKKVGLLNQALSNTANLLNAVNDLVEEFNNLDAIFVGYLESKLGKNPIKRFGNNMLYSLSSENVSTAAHHYQNILDLQKALTDGTDQNLIRELTKTIGTDISVAKGGIGEIAGAYMTSALADFSEEMQKMGVRVTSGGGQDRTYLRSSDARKETISPYSKVRYIDKEGNQRGGFTAKSDYVSSIWKVDSEGKPVEIGLMGISQKSYDHKPGGSNSVMSGSPMNTFFTFAELVDTAFEYVYANNAFHYEGEVKDSKSIMNQYLAARAATFVLSGAFNLKTFDGGTVTPAYFIAYTNKVIYFADFLREAASGSGKKVTLKTDFPDDGIANKFKGTEKSRDPKYQAYQRSVDSLKRVRAKIKFQALIN